MGHVLMVWCALIVIDVKDAPSQLLSAGMIETVSGDTKTLDIQNIVILNPNPR